MVQVFDLLDARTRTRTVSRMRTQVRLPSAISRLMVATETQVCSAACHNVSRLISSPPEP